MPATQKVWADVYTLPVPGCDGKTAAQIFEAAGCETPASPSCAACLGAPPLPLGLCAHALAQLRLKQGCLPALGKQVLCTCKLDSRLRRPGGCMHKAMIACACCMGGQHTQNLGWNAAVPDMEPGCCPAGGPQDTYARMNEAVTCVSTTNRCRAFHIHSKPCCCRFCQLAGA